MIKYIKNLLLITFLCFLSAGRFEYYYQPVLDSNQELFIADGKKIAKSWVNGENVSVFVKRTEKKEALIHIAYGNSTDKNINIFPEDIKVFGYNSNDEKKEFTTYSFKSYMKKLKKKQGWSTALKALGKGLQAAGASQSTSTTTASGSVYGNDGSVYSGFGTATTITHDANAAEAVNARNAQEMKEHKAQLEAISNSTENGLLKSNTLTPNTFIEGNVMIAVNHKYSEIYELVIPFGNETHIIRFRPDK